MRSAKGCVGLNRVRLRWGWWFGGEEVDATESIRAVMAAVKVVDYWEQNVRNAEELFVMWEWWDLYVDGILCVRWRST